MPTQSTSPHLPFGENKNADWYGKDILSVKQFSRADLEYVFGVAHEMRGMVERVGTFDLLKGKILANLFYEPSTRTSSSFTAAMERLGGSVIPISEVKYSSVSKGESLPDTIRTLECYADTIAPVHPDVANVGERVAKRAQFPVEHGGDAASGHIDHAVPEPVVAMCDRDSLLARNPLAETTRDLVHYGKLAGLAVLPLGGPSPHLAFDVALASGEITETDLIDIDSMEIREHIDQVLTGRNPQLHRQQRRTFGAVQHDPVDELHHIEGRAVDVGVRAQPKGPRHRYRCLPDSRDDAVLPGHVVRCRQNVTGRRSTQDDSVAHRIRDPESQIRPATRDQVCTQRTMEPFDVGLQPLGNLGKIETLHRADSSCRRRPIDDPMDDVRPTRAGRKSSDGSVGTQSELPGEWSGHPGRLTPTTLSQRTVVTVTVLPVAGAWIIDPPPM